MTGPCQRFQDNVNEVQGQINDIQDSLPDLPVALRAHAIAEIAALGKKLQGLKYELSVCLRNPAPYELQLDGLEVVQTVQGLDNTVPLVAGKATVVRAYLSYYQATAITVTATLRAQVAGGGAPVTITSQANVVMDPAAAGDTAGKRLDPAKSLNFVLPAGVTGEGLTQLSLDTVVDVATGNPVPGAYSAPLTVTFDAAHPLRVHVTSIGYLQFVGTPPRLAYYVATQTDLDNLKSWLGRAYPIASIVWSTATVANTATVPFDYTAINTQLAALRAQDVAAGTDKRTHYYGIVSDGGFFMRGAAASIPTTPDPSVCASGPTGRNTWGWDNDGSYGDWYGGHEIGHTFGRYHPGSGCGESSDDPNYPYPAGQLASSSTGCVGYDTGDPALGFAAAAYPGTTWHDVMTYCSNQWISDYTYKGIKDRLAAEDALTAGPVPPQAVPVAASSGGAPDRRVPEHRLESEVPEADQSGGEAGKLVHVVCSINLSTGQGHIAYVNPLPAGEPTTAQPGSRVTVRVLAADQTLLQQHPAAVQISSEIRPGDDVTGLIDVTLAVDDRASTVELAVDGRVVDTFRGTGPPAADQRAGRSQVDGDHLRVEWAASASPGADSGTGHTYILQVSRDGGQSWRTLGIGLTEAEAAIDRRQFTPDEEVQLRVIATNGFDQSVVYSETVTPR